MRGKKAIKPIIGAIFGVVIAVIFVIVAADILGDYFSQFPRVGGAVGDPAMVICFGGGADHHVHCLEKTTAKEIFSIGSGTGWSEQNAETAPVLTDEAIYLSIGNRICAYSFNSINKWGSCIANSDTIEGEIAVSKEGNLVCYKDSGKIKCLDKTTGELQFRTKQEYTAVTNPIIDDGDYVYFIGEIISEKVNQKELCIYPPRTTGDADRSNCKQISIFFGISNAVLYNNMICLLTGADLPGNQQQEYKCFDKNANLIASWSVGNMNYDTSFGFMNPSIDGEWMYYSGNKVIYRTNLTKVLETKTWNYEQIADKFTSIKVTASDEMMCFGVNDYEVVRGKNQLRGTIYCLNMTSNKYQIQLKASENWDDYKAESTPAIIRNKVYFALGDHVFAYYANGTLYWPYDGIDFDHQISTGIATHFETGVADEI